MTRERGSLKYLRIEGLAYGATGISLIILGMVFCPAIRGRVDQCLLNVTGDIANLLQAIFALWMLVITAYLAKQVSEVEKQTSIQRNILNSESYRRLISPELQSIRLFIRREDFRDKLGSLKNKLEIVGLDCQKALDEFRSDVDVVARSVSLPLLDRDVCLEDIEALINEYNYLCMQLQEGIIVERFATELALKNFVTVYDTLDPFIVLRSRLASEYASHFKKWVRERRCT